MLFILLNIIVLGAAAAGSWWLSGYDVKVRGEKVVEDNILRAIRCGISLFLVEGMFSAAWWSCHGDKFAGFFFLPLLVAFALLWAGCISELAATFFHELIDPPDKRGYYPQKGVRELDAVGDLIRSGRKEEAIKLCQMLLQHSDDNRAALEMTLHHLGVPQAQLKQTNPLVEAHRLRQVGKFDQAEMILSALLSENPANVEAAMMLMRFYTQNMQRRDKAMEVLRSLEQQPRVSRSYIEFAHRSLEEQQKPRYTEPPPIPLPKSVEEMLACSHFGTAIETLQQQVTNEPENFDARLKLAEVYGKHCSDFRMAEKIVRQIEANRAFNPEQIQQARTKLGEWRDSAKNLMAQEKAGIAK